MEFIYEPVVKVQLTPYSTKHLTLVNSWAFKYSKPTTEDLIESFWVHFQHGFQFLALLGKLAFTYDVRFWGMFDLPTFPNQIFYYIRKPIY